MPVETVTDPFKRHKTRYRGISYRERADGTRTYYVYHGGKQLQAQGRGGEKEAIEFQAALRSSVAPVVVTRTKFKALAEVWYDQKVTRLRKRTADYYRSGLDLVLLPRFGKLRIDAIDADQIAKLVRDLEREGLHAIDPSRPVRPLGRSSIENYLKPLQGVMTLALRRKMIASNPFDLLTNDDRPKREEKEDPYEWSDEEITKLIEASKSLAAKPQSRFDYSLLLWIAARLGLRLGEVLGLRWEDFDKTGTLSIKRQWLRTGEYGPTKTPAGMRTIALPASIREELIALRLQSSFSRDEHPIFASRTGTPLSHRNVTARGFERARDLAKLPEHLTFHDLRHAAASRLIDAGLDSVTVAEVLGHEDATTTLKVYAKRFNRRRSDDRVREALG
jgi:integrase